METFLVRPRRSWLRRLFGWMLPAPAASNPPRTRVMRGNRRAASLTPQEVAEVRDSYAAGESSSSIGKRMRLAKGTVVVIAKREGVPAHPSRSSNVYRRRRMADGTYRRMLPPGMVAPFAPSSSAPVPVPEPALVRADAGAAVAPSLATTAPPRSTRFMGDDTRLAIAQAYTDGEFPSSVAARYGCAVSHVKACVKAVGGTCAPSGNRGRVFRFYAPDGSCREARAGSPLALAATAMHLVGTGSAVRA